MDQIVQFTAPPTEYPHTVDALDPTEIAFLQGVRRWVAARQRGDHPRFHLLTALNGVGAEAAASPLERFLTLAAYSTCRRVVTYCPYSPQLGEDEKQMLYSASLVQNGEIEFASRVLQATILTTEGAVLALGPLEEIGEHFAKSGLLFRRRKRPAVEPEFPATVERWISSLSSMTLH
jgi:hypothetical protein